MSTALEAIREHLAAAHERCAAVGFEYDAQPKEAVPACPLCGASEARPLASVDRYGFSVESSVCLQCSFVWLSERMTREGYAEFYKHWYRPLVAAFSDTPCDAASIQESQRIYARHLCSVVERFAAMPYRRTLLDVGGSTGILADEFRARWGYRTTVLDPAPDELAYAAAGSRVIHSLLEDWDTSERFDVVAMIQTVDHLLDLPGSLAKLRRLVNPYGFVLIDFVNWSRLFRRHMPAQTIKIDHPLYFGPHTALAALLSAGLEPLVNATADGGKQLIFVCRPGVPCDLRPHPDDVAAELSALGVAA